MLESLTREVTSAEAASLNTIETPALVLDVTKVDRNIARLRQHLAGLDVDFRPHVKTAKSIDVARRLFPDGVGPITVSTLAEAEHFAGHGFRDIIYAVGLAPQKAERVLQLRRAGVDLKVILDTVDQARALGAAGRAIGVTASALIEIDTDNHRGGLAPDDPLLVEVAAALRDSDVELAGVLTHAGESYALSDPESLAAAAEGERAGAVAAATALRRQGYDSPMVSVGSTPTAHFARNLDGVTEVRAGVFVFFDLVMLGIGVCHVDDIALSVLATVIGNKPEKGWILVDSGWMALSRDRGTASQAVDQGYGVVCDMGGRPYPDLIVAQASQEHGVLALRAASDEVLPDLSVGTRVRILPNHACATAAQHTLYNVIAGSDPEVQGQWPRMRGW